MSIVSTKQLVADIASVFQPQHDSVISWTYDWLHQTKGGCISFHLCVKQQLLISADYMQEHLGYEDEALSCYV